MQCSIRRTEKFSLGRMSKKSGGLKKPSAFLCSREKRSPKDRAKGNGQLTLRVSWPNKRKRDFFLRLPQKAWARSENHNHAGCLRPLHVWGYSISVYQNFFRCCWREKNRCYLCSLLRRLSRAAPAATAITAVHRARLLLSPVWGASGSPAPVAGMSTAALA